MKRDKKTAGTSIAEEVLKRVPEAAREAVRSALLETNEVVDFLGEAALRQDDYSRSLDEVTGYKKQLDGWYAQKQADLARVDELTQQLEDLKTRGGDDDGIVAPDTAAMKRLEAELKSVKDAVVETQRDGLAVMRAMHKLNVTHTKEFGEPLDFDGLIEFSRQQQIPLEQAFDRFVADKRHEKQEHTVAELVKAAEEKGRNEALRQINDRPPYPVGGQEPSVFDTIAGKPPTENFGVERAVEGFYKRQAAG